MGVIVKIIGENKGSDEYVAGLRFKELVENLPANVIGEVVIYPNATILGQAVKDIDIVVVGELKNYAPSLKYYDNGEEKLEKISIESFCFTIEVKSHDASAIVRRGTDWFVPYRQGMHNVTEQSNNQKTSLFSFFKNQIGLSPYVTNVIWFTETLHSEIDKLKKTENSKIDANVLSGECDFKEFAQQIVLQSNLYKRRNSIVVSAMPAEYDLQRFEKAMSFFSTQKAGMGELTRKRVEKITRKTFEGGIVQRQLGKLSIYRGRAGTGKTIGLIQTAIEMVDEEDCRILILTYNKLLVSDIRRLFALAELPDMFDYRCVGINTLQSFFYKLLNRCIYDCRLDSRVYLENYEAYMKEALDMLADEAMLEIVVDQCKQDLDLNWDYVFVDEAQDWTDFERDIILKLFDPERIVIADGGQQFVRKISPCDWLVVKERNNIKLKKCLRQKSNLIKVLNRISEYYSVTENKIVGSENMIGGRVIVTDDKSKLMTTLKSEIATLLDSGNALYDCLCMAPSGMVSKSFGDRMFKETDDFVANGLEIWDGTNPNNRDSMIIPSDKIRVIQYDSARGLEGWLCVCLGLDQFIDEKMSLYKAEDNRNELMLESETELRTKYLLNWLFMPLTRAIDTIVISLNDKYSEVGKMLYKLAEDNPDYINWI